MATTHVKAAVSASNRISDTQPWPVNVRIGLIIRFDWDGNEWRPSLGAEAK